MDVAYINPFITATRVVFQTMVNVPIQLGRPHLRNPSESFNRLYRISAAIGLSGATSGLLILNLSEAVAIALASGLAGTPFTELNADCFDALAEIANMIAGSAKKDFPGGQVSLTVPTLLQTQDVVYPKGQPVVAIPFDTSVGRFMIEVAIGPRGAVQASASPSPSTN